MELTHLDQNGEVRMVDVGEKEITARTAVGFAAVRMQPETLSMLLEGDLKKGDALSAARVAGIMAAKRTWELIPLCHQIPLEHVSVSFENDGRERLFIYATARCSYKTGVEMEALTAASVAALTVYDMCKAVDRGMTVENIRLLRKAGGKSGEYRYEG